VFKIVFCSFILFVNRSYAKPINFLFITKDIGTVFFQKIKAGCNKRANELKNVNCIFAVMNQANPRLQISTLEEKLKIHKIDGVAFAVINSPFSSIELDKIIPKNLPFITIDADFKPEDLKKANIKRQAYVGTNNYLLGKKLGELYSSSPYIKNNLCIISGHKYSDNLNLRIKGFRNALKENKINTDEIERCPVYSLENSTNSINMMQSMIKNNLSKNRPLTLAIMGAWPQQNPAKYRKVIAPYKSFIESGKLQIISIDTVDSQIELLKDGLSNLNVGQSPNGMGVMAIDVLYKIYKKEQFNEINNTPITVCNKDNYKSCTK
jgi:ribose transport system substrate-binding protein